MNPPLSRVGEGSKEFTRITHRSEIFSSGLPPAFGDKKDEFNDY